jgi:hypothetical protein
MIRPFVPVLILATGMFLPVLGQSWDFVKEKDGIKLYTRIEAGKSIKAYRGVTEIRAPAEKIFSLIEDINHTEWWDKDVNQIRVFAYEKYKMAKYYMVYDLPWPVTDRDLCVEVKSSYDSVTGVGTVSAFPLVGFIPENKEKVRIRDYHQTWTVRSAGNGISNVELVGFVDPSGSIPDWITNLVLVESPLKAIGNIRRMAEGK